MKSGCVVCVCVGGGGGGGGGVSPKAIISNFYYHFCGTKVKWA